MREPIHWADVFAGLDLGPKTRAPIVRHRTERQPLPQFLRRAVVTRDNLTCRECRKNAQRKSDGPNLVLEVDHIVPWSAGGADHPVNLRTLCQDCNQQRSNYVTGAEKPAELIFRTCLVCMTYAVQGNIEPYMRHGYCLGCHGWNTGLAVPRLLVGGAIPAEGVPPA